ncbi:MAG: ATP-binding protein [candidate division Zixibacteria bacterium]|nr:ATP-binding protein [candidate division Zixibacteria bacterium]
MSDITRKDLFVGREKEIEIFNKTLTEKFGTPAIGDESAEPKVIVYHGVAGIGKTALCDELSKEELKKSFNYAAWCKVDFRTKTYTDPETGLFHIRNQLSNNHNMKFPSFDIAYGIYWKKANPQKSLDEKTFAAWGNSELITDVVGTLSDAPAVGWIPKIGKLIEKGNRHLDNKKTIQSSELLQSLPAKEAHQILEILPELLAEDITLNFEKESPKHQAVNTQPTIIFLDTYEMIWGEAKENLAKPAIDKWIMTFARACKHALIVITGKQELKWKKREDFWDETRLKQYEILGLAKDKAIEYLIENGIKDKAIQDKIYSGSKKGVPFYLDVSIDTYNSILNDKKTPTVDDFVGTYQEVLERFTDNIPDMELNALHVLSSARYWDKEIFELLKNSFSDNFNGVTIKGLYHYSFITKNDTELYVMHDLMREHLHAFCEKDDSESYFDVHQALFEYYDNPLKDIKKPIDVSDEHKHKFDEAFYHACMPINLFANWAMGLLIAFYHAAQYGFAEQYYLVLIGLLDNDEDDSQELLFSVIANLAQTYRDRGRYDDAKLLYKAVIKILNTSLGKNHPHYATSLNNLGSWYDSQGRYEEAEQLYKQAIEINKIALGKNHPDFLAELNNLALLYDSQGRYEEAESLYKQAIEIWKISLGDEHPEYAKCLTNLAGLYNAQGRYDDAEPLFKQALEIDKEAIGEYHPDYAIALNNLAASYHSQGRYDEAEPLCKQAMDITKNAVGENHPGYAIRLNNLAELNRAQGRYDEAKPLYRQALIILTDAFGELHPNVIRTLNNMGVLYQNMGNEGKAREYQQRAEALQKQRDAQTGKAE